MTSYAKALFHGIVAFMPMAIVGCMIASEQKSMTMNEPISSPRNEGIVKVIIPAETGSEFFESLRNENFISKFQPVPKKDENGDFILELNWLNAQQLKATLARGFSGAAVPMCVESCSHGETAISCNSNPSASKCYKKVPDPQENDPLRTRRVFSNLKTAACMNDSLAVATLDGLTYERSEGQLVQPSQKKEYCAPGARGISMDSRYFVVLVELLENALKE